MAKGEQWQPEDDAEPQLPEHDAEPQLPEHDAEQIKKEAEEVTEELESIMKPYAKWGEYLLPAPLSIATMGNLIFIAARQGDFPIKNNTRTTGFKYIKDPGSFRACLCQVSHECWQFFKEAEASMDQIRILTAGIPGKTVSIVQTLFQENNVVNALLPGQLKNMQSIAEQCAAKALTVKNQNDHIISLIQEIVEALSAKQDHKEELKEVSIAVETIKRNLEETEKAEKQAKEDHDKVKQQLSDYFYMYHTIIEGIPTGWPSKENLFSFFKRLWAKLISMFTGSTSESTSSAEQTIPLSPVLLTYATGLKDMVVDQEGLKMENIHDNKPGQVKTNWVKSGFLCVKGIIEKELDCLCKEKALSVCLLGIQVCKQLEQMAKSSKNGTEDEKCLVKEIKKLHQQATELDSYYEDKCGSAPFAPKPPSKSGDQQRSTGKCSAESLIHVRAGVATAERLTQTMKILTTTREEWKRSADDLEKQKQKLASIRCNLDEHAEKEKDISAALDVLVKGLKAMGEMKEQWQKMNGFFQMISSLIEIAVNQKMKEADLALDVKKIEDYSSKPFVRNVIYKLMLSVSGMARLVHMLAETYSQVSKEHLMDKVSRLERLMTLEPSDPMFKAEEDTLNKSCQEACDAINSMATKKAEFNGNLLSGSRPSTPKGCLCFDRKIRSEREMNGNGVCHILMD